MRLSILAARRQAAIEAIGTQSERITGKPLDLVTGARGDADHRQLEMLERIAAFLADVDTSGDVDGLYSVDEILAVPGLTKTSITAIKEAFGDASTD